MKIFKRMVIQIILGFRNVHINRWIGESKMASVVQSARTKNVNFIQRIYYQLRIEIGICICPHMLYSYSIKLYFCSFAKIAMVLLYILTV